MPDRAAHHYVRQFVLRQFRNAHGQVDAYDKITDRLLHVGVRVAAQSAGFNADGGDDRLESLLAHHVDDPAARAVRLLVDGTHPIELTPEQILAVRRFAVVQVFRGPYQRRLNPLLLTAEPRLKDFGHLEFGPDGSLTQAGQLRMTSALLQSWSSTPPARWRVAVVMSNNADPDDVEFVIPDEGCTLFHPDLQTRGWVDASLEEMSCVHVPVGPRHAVVLINPDFDPLEAVPTSTQARAAAWARAKRYVYGRITADLLSRLRQLREPGYPLGGRPFSDRYKQHLQTSGTRVVVLP